MNRDSVSIPLNVSLNLEVPYAKYVDQVGAIVQAELDSKSDEILDQVRLFVSAQVNENLHNKVIQEVNRVVDIEVRNAISAQIIERSVKTALRKATAEAVARVFGHDVQ